MGKRLQLEGKVFGRLTVIEHAGHDKHGHNLWKCQCKCGNECIVRGGSLKFNNTKSCGCLVKQGKARAEWAETIEVKYKTIFGRGFFRDLPGCQAEEGRQKK